MRRRRNEDVYKRQVVVLNNLQYASYVEYGHRQQPGRFIPGYWESDRFVYDPDVYKRQVYA